MGQIFRTARAAAFGAIGVTALIATSSVAVFTITSTSAQAAKAKPAAPKAPLSEADQKKAELAAARNAYESGIKSYAAGKYQPAVDLLSTALRGGGLASGDMAKALYVRGVSYKKLSKPGLAISDLTSALWLKNGLGEADQKAAMAERAEAYRMAGLGDGNSGNDRVSIADPNPTPSGAKATTPPAAQAVAPAAPAAPAKKGAKTAAAAPAPAPEPVQTVTRQAPDSQAAIDAANARRNAAAPIDGGIYSAANATLIGEPARTPVAAAAPVAAPAAVAIPAPIPAAPAAQTVAAASSPTISAPLDVPSAPKAGPALKAPTINGLPPAEIPTTQQSVPNTVSGFFSNIFGGGSKTEAATPPPGTSAVTTASTTPAAPAAGNWANATSVASGAKTAAAAPAQATPSGKYKLHIAAVRSRAEAEALAQKLTAQQGPALKSRMPVVDEAVIGSMGTFYRVRVGSYATPDEPRGVCNTLRASGFDCLVVTN